MKRNLLITLALSTAIAANAQDGMPVTVQLQAVPSGTKITKVHSPTPMRAGVNTTLQQDVKQPWEVQQIALLLLMAHVQMFITHRILIQFLLSTEVILPMV